METPKIKVVVADDNPVVRSGLASLLEADDIAVVGQAGDGRQAIELTQRLRPDVVLLDVQMPLLDGVKAAEQLAGISRLIMVTYTISPEVIKTTLAMGAVGYLVHGAFTAEELLAAVRQAAEGANPLSQAAISVLVDGLRTQPAAPAADQRNGFGLSAREAEVMDLISEGQSNTEIAVGLFLSEKTVKNHVNRIYAKLGVTSRTAAVARWLGTATAGGPRKPGSGRPRKLGREAL